MSLAIASGVSLFYLARLLGSSIARSTRRTATCFAESEEYLRGLLDTFDADAAAETADG